MNGIVISKPSKDELEELRVSSWGIWEREESTFDLEYEETEICYILQGHAQVETDTGETVEFGEGDLVSFAKGLKCIWTITEPIRKHYRFSD